MLHLVGCSRWPVAAAHALMHLCQLLTVCKLHPPCCLLVAPGEGPVLCHALALTALVDPFIHISLHLDKSQQQEQQQQQHGNDDGSTANQAVPNGNKVQADG